MHFCNRLAQQLRKDARGTGLTGSGSGPEPSPAKILPLIDIEHPAASRKQSSFA